MILYTTRSRLIGKWLDTLRSLRGAWLRGESTVLVSVSPKTYWKFE